MSTFNDREQQTIKEHCGDWVLYSVDELENQLAAERAKVALAVEALKKRSHCKISWNGQPGMNCRDVRNAVLSGTSKATKGWEEENRLHPENVLCADCQTAEFLATLPSGDALAEIKRNIFEEWCDLVCQEHPWIDRKRMQDAIRDKFGVAE